MDAKKAKELSEGFFEHYYSPELQEILGLIEHAASHGEKFISTKKSISRLTEDALKRRGFSVFCRYGFFSSTCIISWL